MDYKNKYLEYKIKYFELKKQFKNQKGGYNVNGQNFTFPLFKVGERVENTLNYSSATVKSLRQLANAYDPNTFENYYEVKYDTGILETVPENVLIRSTNVSHPSIFNPAGPVIPPKKFTPAIPPATINPYYPYTPGAQVIYDPYTPQVSPYYQPAVYKPTVYYDDDIKPRRKSSRKLSRKSSRKTSRKSSKKSSRKGKGRK